LCVTRHPIWPGGYELPVSKKQDPFNLELELPDGRDFISRPPKLSLEEYESWCEEYWAAKEKSKRVDVASNFEEFRM
jgi:hypothetical protein